MTKKYPSERAAELFNQAIAALQRIENAPQSPIAKFHSKQERRELRRAVLQLRRGQIVPEEGSPYSAEELADLYVLTMRRDEIVDEARADFRRTELPLDRLAREEGAAVAETFKMMVEEAEEGVRLHGPGSEDAQRLQMMQLLVELGQKFATKGRRQNGSHRVYLTRHFGAAPAPAREQVFVFPAEGADPARSRMLIRIGIGNVSWIGNFEAGDTEHTTVQLLPDLKHLLVVAGGAGYILDGHTRALVERIGNDIVSDEDAHKRFLDRG